MMCYDMACAVGLSLWCHDHVEKVSRRSDDTSFCSPHLQLPLGRCTALSCSSSLQQASCVACKVDHPRQSISSCLQVLAECSLHTCNRTGHTPCKAVSLARSSTAASSE